MKRKRDIIGAAAITIVAATAGLAILRRFSRYPGVKIRKSITVDRPADELYGYWRNLENLPAFVDLLESVEVVDDKRSRWTVRGPGNVRLEWNAEVTVDREGEMIGFRSVDGAAVDVAGYVRFEPATGGRGTVIRVALQYVPPAGKLGAVVSTILGKRPGGWVEEALRRFKQLVEAGELATTTQPRHTARVIPFIRSEMVEIASEDSFPASDPPAWTGTGL